MKRILIAADGSSHAKEAARFLSQLPHRNPIEVDVLTVVEPSFRESADATRGERADGARDEISAATRAYKTIEHLFAGSSATVRHETIEGKVGETIVNVAGENDVELIVVGARGRSAVQRILLGSISDYVATHAECSVLVVRRSNKANGDRPLRVAIGFEDSPPAHAALDEFTEFDWGARADVDVLSVTEYVEGFSRKVTSNSASAKSLKREVQDAVKRLQAAVTRTKARFVKSEHTGEGIVRFLEDHGSDLVVIGETPRGVIGRFVLGSVSRFVLRHAPCSVWITRNSMVETDHAD